MSHQGQATPESATLPHHNAPHTRRRYRVWHRILGKDDRPWVSWRDSARAIFFVSWLNIFLLCIPIAWVSHYDGWSPGPTFSLSFMAIIALEKLFDWGGEQIAMYCGPDLGDLIVVTLNNGVEATLAIILLIRCELKLLQSTITGVVLLHLLLVPGTAFLVGGARVWEQKLHPHRSQLNLTLLTVGVLALTVPAAFFAAIDGNTANSESGSTSQTDARRDDFLRISRGFAVILLVIYVCSRFYLHDPPGEDNAFMPHPDIPQEALEKERELESAEPEVNPWACIILLTITVTLMAFTAEFLVSSVETLQARDSIQEEWFGIILLPIVSFSADAVLAIWFFIRSCLRHFFRAPSDPDILAEARAIDMSIQFLLFWAPFVTLLGWWLNKPMSLLFDLFEVVLLVGACFLVNYVTADAKTNWAEGWILVSFYIMIGLSAWYYPGQDSVRTMNACEGITAALASGVGTNE